MGNLGRYAFLLGLVAAAGGAGCFLSEDDSAQSDDDITDGPPVEVAAVLKSTLILDEGCTAAKVGARHLLVAARCVAGNRAFAPGKIIKFKAATEGASI